MITQVSTLDSASIGSFICTGIDADAVSPGRMQSLGICVGRPLELVSTGDPLIVRVCGTSVGLSRRLAATVRVAPQRVLAKA